MEYKIQLIHFNGKKTHRILQNVGGPCPLLGLCNVLLLNNDIRVNQKIKTIKFSDLTHCLKDHLQKLFEVNMGSKQNIDESQMANAIQNIDDTIKLFPKLEEGLDINIKFSDVTDFEFTSAVAMFDNYNIRILHGWLPDPQQIELYKIMKDKSYNEMVDFLTSENDSKADDAQFAEAEQEKTLIRQFLNDYQQQLTSHGLIRMHEVMNDNEIAIFFRNNHFSAVYKRNGQIWELVTDEGIVDADPRITWQSLSQLSGDEQFVSNTFNIISQNINQQQQIESYNNTLKQQQQNGFTIQQQEEYLKQQYEDSNKNIIHDNNDNNNNNDDSNDNNDNNGNKNDSNDIINNKDNDNNNNDNNNNDNNNNDNNNDNDKNNNKSADDLMNIAVAERIALEEQLGLNSGDLEKLEKEQKEAMEQWEKQQKIQQQQQEQKYGKNPAISSNHYPSKPYNNNNNNNYNNYNKYNNNTGSYAYTQSFDRYPHKNKNKNRKKGKRKRNGNRDEDNCVIL